MPNQERREAPKALRRRRLQLWVQPNGSRLWRFAYRYAGKQKVLALGSYPDLSLKEVRLLREQAKALLRDGTDPFEARRQARILGAGPANSFQGIAEEYIAKKAREGRAPSTISKLTWLLSFAYPALGSHLPVGDVGCSAIEGRVGRRF